MRCRWLDRRICFLCGVVVCGGLLILRMVELTGARAVVSTLAGSGNPTFADASGTNAAFDRPWGVAVDASGNMIVSDQSNQRSRKVTAGGGMRIGPVTLRALA
jgi:hypothetical protein